MSLKNKTFIGGWISIAAKAYRHDKIMKERNLHCRSEDWIYRECGITKQAICNYRNIYKLVSVAPTLLNYRVNMTYFVKNHKILFSYFEENKEQIHWKHKFYCTCEDCNS